MGSRQTPDRNPPARSTSVGTSIATDDHGRPWTGTSKSGTSTDKLQVLKGCCFRLRIRGLGVRVPRARVGLGSRWIEEYVGDTRRPTFNEANKYASCCSLVYCSPVRPVVFDGFCHTLFANVLADLGPTPRENALLRGKVGGMSTHRCTCGNRLLSAEEIGKILNPTDPLTPASGRREMSRAGIGKTRGYPADQVRAYAAGHPGKSRRGHT